jgi:hypothetical protein
MRQAWERALAILNEGDRNWIQQIPKDLTENEGKYNSLVLSSQKLQQLQEVPW